MNEEVIETIFYYDRYTNMSKALVLKEKYEKLQQENKHLTDLYNQALKDYDEIQKENKELKRNLEIKNAYCQSIVNLGYDYDGFNKVDSLKGLIDELVRYATLSIDNDDKTISYEGEAGIKYNILFEELERDETCE